MSIIRRDSERVRGSKKMFGGEGEPSFACILNTPEEMSGKGRLFNHVYLQPGEEVGWHIHNGDGETYYILKGTAQYNDNGNLVTLNAGDLSVVYAGEGHSIKNIGSDTLEMIALILYS